MKSDKALLQYSGGVGTWTIRWENEIWCRSRDNLHKIFVWTFTTPKLMTLVAKDSYESLSSSKIVLKFLSLESVLPAGKRNAVGA